MISAQTHSAFVARKSRYPLFRIMLWSDRTQVASMSERPPISPRSPRAALEPEQVPPPPRRSERARNPLVVFGNAVITIVLIAMLGGGAVYVYGRQMLESPGPLQEEKIVNIPARSKTRDIADI